MADSSTRVGDIQAYKRGLAHSVRQRKRGRVQKINYKKKTAQWCRYVKGTQEPNKRACNG